MNKNTIKFNTDYSNTPLIKLKSNETEFYALVDSGSDSTLVDSEFITEQQIDQETTDLVETYIGFNGSSDFPISYSNIECVIVGDDADYPININATISNLSAIQAYFDKWSDGEILVPLIIGSDTLTKMQATIDFKTNTFSFYTDGDEDRQTPALSGEEE